MPCCCTCTTPKPPSAAARPPAGPELCRSAQATERPLLTRGPMRVGDVSLRHDSSGAGSPRPHARGRCADMQNCTPVVSRRPALGLLVGGIDGQRARVHVRLGVLVTRLDYGFGFAVGL